MLTSKYNNDVIAVALMETVVPALAAAINAAAPEVAHNLCGDVPNVFEVEQAEQQLILSLADLLLLCENDHSEDHIYAPLRPHQLQDMRYTGVFFGLKPAEIDDMIGGAK